MNFPEKNEGISREKYQEILDHINDMMFEFQRKIKKISEMEMMPGMKEKIFSKIEKRILSLMEMNEYFLSQKAFKIEDLEKTSSSRPKSGREK